MDLISIARKYKRVRITIITIFIIIVLTYMCLIVSSFIENQRRDKIYQSYQKLYEKLNGIEIGQAGGQSQQIQIAKQVTNVEQWLYDVDNIYKVHEKRVFLTFDDGPSSKVTPNILDILKRENIKATFFVLGSRVELNPELIKREYEEGHYIANHGYSHQYSQIYSSVEALLDEYYKTEDAIKRAIGNEQYTSHLFRFPGGSTGGKYDNLKKQAKDKLEENNIAYLDWNSLIGDAEGGKKTVEKLISRFNETTADKNTLVILMHDAGDKETTYEALPQIIENLRANGYEFKNFYDLIE